jgi:hypothetical protein
MLAAAAASSDGMLASAAAVAEVDLTAGHSSGLCNQHVHDDFHSSQCSSVVSLDELKCC